MTDGASIAQAADAVLETVGDRGVAGLVNNAGVVVPGPLEFLDLGELRRQLEVNVIGQIAVTQAFLGALRRARGRVVNIGSIGGRVAHPFLGPYNASKFALEALTDSLRLELHASGIEVSIVEPGSVATSIWAKADASADTVVGGLSALARDLYGEAIAAMRATSDAVRRAGHPREPRRAGGGARAHRAAAEDTLPGGPRRARAGAREVAAARPAARSPDALADWRCR